MNSNIEFTVKYDESGGAWVAQSPDGGGMRFTASTESGVRELAVAKTLENLMVTNWSEVGK